MTEGGDKLFRTGRPIEAPSLDDLAAWEQSTTLEDKNDGIKKGPLRPREKGPPVGSVSTSTLLRHSETAHPAPPAGEPAVPDPNPEPAVPVRCGVRSSVARRVPGTLWTVGTHASRPGRKAHNCHPSRGAGGVSPEGP